MGKEGDVGSVLERDSAAVLSFISPRLTKTSEQKLGNMSLREP